MTTDPQLGGSSSRNSSGGKDSNKESPPTTKFSNNKRFELADLLRDCAALVEQNEMDQKVFQRMFLDLTAYVQSHGSNTDDDDDTVDNKVSAAPAVPKVASNDSAPDDERAAPKSKPANHKTSNGTSAAATATAATVATDPPGSVSQKPAPGLLQKPTPPPPNVTSARRVTTTTTTKHVPPPPPKAGSTSSRSRGGDPDDSALSNQKAHNFLGKISKNVKDMGHEFTHIAHTGQRALSHAAKNATSAKNAQRARSDIASELNADVWCEEHFTMGCACKLQAKKKQQRAAPPSTSERSTGTAGDSSGAATSSNARPCFQRPVNPSSTLIANGWLEQQRRSKMRTVWKEVLVSLVAGRRPGEETTLWIQRETTNPVTGTTGLEALHQIPIKGMQDVNYVDFSSDHRFVIQVFNLSDEFIFRTRDNADAAKNWVSTLRLTREAIMNGVAPPKAGDLVGASRRTKTYPGYSEDEKKEHSPPQQNHPQQPQTSKRLSVKDLRAIAHEHSVNTAGMERGELEACVAKIQKQHGGRATPQPPSGPPPASAQKSKDLDDGSGREAQRLAQADKQREAERRARQMKLDEETAARLAAEEHAEAERILHRQRHAQADADERRRAEYRRQQEGLRQQQTQAAAQQKWHDDQRKAQQAQAAEEEQRRQYQQQQQQQHQYYVQQQAQWHQQQQQQKQQEQWQRNQRPTPPVGYPQPQVPRGQQNPRQDQPRPGPPPISKWVNMASEESDGGQATITTIKHDILVKWALQAPSFQTLRSIDALLTTIHTIFPPCSGVPGHDYFKKWKAVSADALSENGRLDESKLAKAVKKLRFFLHPDKLPRDLNDEQSFVCKMLWDITSDAWEEYEKRKEDLDWLNGS